MDFMQQHQTKKKSRNEYIFTKVVSDLERLFVFLKEKRRT